MSNSQLQDSTEVLLALHRIEDRLQQILDVLRISHKENIDSVQKKVLSGSPLRKQIFELCDGTHTVGQIGETLGKSMQQISNNIALLQSAGLIKEVRKGKTKCYAKAK